MYIDTHAGAGMYSLTEGYAIQNAEFKEGISKLIASDSLPKPLEKFVAQIKRFNTNSLEFYPGSPMVAQDFLRADDKMRLFELHPSDCKLLEENFRGQEKQVKIEMKDGFSGIKSCLPPPSRRAAVLIDPPYEDKQDYLRVVNVIKDCLTRFPTGTYIVWYPILQRPEPGKMVEDLINLNLPSWLNVSMKVHKPSAEGFGMYGSGLFIVNPSWTLPKTLEVTMPILTQLLSLDITASYELKGRID